MENQVEQFISQFGGKFKLVDYGMNENFQYDGFWLVLKAIKPININSFNTGSIYFDIQGDTITVNKGFLNEMAQGLSMIASFV